MKRSKNLNVVSKSLKLLMGDAHQENDELFECKACGAMLGPDDVDTHAYWCN
jgi:hypothetical protein